LSRDYMAVLCNDGTSRARHSVRAAVVNQQALVGKSDVQWTAREKRETPQQHADSAIRNPTH
jgi:hypothetical protein